MNPRDERADELADDALLATMRLLVHLGGGVVVVQDEGGETFEVIDARLFGLLEQAVRAYWKGTRDREGGAGAEGAMDLGDLAALRSFLDAQWAYLANAISALYGEAQRRIGEAGLPIDLDDPALGLD